MESKLLPEEEVLRQLLLEGAASSHKLLVRPYGHQHQDIISWSNIWFDQLHCLTVHLLFSKRFNLPLDDLFKENLKLFVVMVKAELWQIVLYKALLQKCSAVFEQHMLSPLLCVYMTQLPGLARRIHPNCLDQVAEFTEFLIFNQKIQELRTEWVAYVLLFIGLSRLCLLLVLLKAHYLLHVLRLHLGLFQTCLVFLKVFQGH